MSAAEKGWHPIEGGEEGETHGFSGRQAMLRSNPDDVVDPALIKVVEELPPEEKSEAHREVEIEARLTKEEFVAAKATLEKQNAKIVLACEIEQVWYDASHICAGMPVASSLDLGRPQWVCKNMQIRVRSITTDAGTEFHWCVKIPGADSSERLEFEGFVTTTWDDALIKLNEKIAELLNTELHGVEFKPIAKDTGELMHAKKKRTSYRYDERPDGRKFPCTGSQVDFDEWTEINGHTGEPILDADGNPTGEREPLLITVDVEGKTLNGDAAGLTPEQARRVPSVENCAWCLSLPENGGYNLFKTVGENWPKT